MIFVGFNFETMRIIHTAIAGFLLSIAFGGATTANMHTPRHYTLQSFWHLTMDSPTILTRARRQLERTRQRNCTYDPFLWKIYRTATNVTGEEHVGFGVGTVHLPVSVVLNNQAWDDIQLAIQSSCAVYAEVNLLDSTVDAQFQACVEDIGYMTPMMLVSDIENATLQQKFDNVISDIAADLNPDNAESIETDLQNMTLDRLLPMIEAYKTPDYWPLVRNYLLGGPPPQTMDEAILALGRPPGGLEDMETHCQALGVLYPTAEDVDINVNTAELHLEKALSQSLVEVEDEYRCGDLSVIEDWSLPADASFGIMAQVLYGKLNAVLLMCRY
jgi:hypothetical protein